MTEYGLGSVSHTRGYLVLVPVMLIARDISVTITDYDPTATVMCAQLTADAEAALGRVSRLEIAFIDCSPKVFLGTKLHGDILKKGGRVILLGVAAESYGPGPVFDVLPQPFNTDDLRAKLRSGHTFGA